MLLWNSYDNQWIDKCLLHLMQYTNPIIPSHAQENWKTDQLSNRIGANTAFSLNFTDNENQADHTSV